MERVGEDLISATDGQVSCKGGRRDTSNLEKTGSEVNGGGMDGESGEARAEAEGGLIGERAEEGLERVSATTISGPGT